MINPIEARDIYQCGFEMCSNFYFKRKASWAEQMKSFNILTIISCKENNLFASNKRFYYKDKLDKLFKFFHIVYMCFIHTLFKHFKSAYSQTIYVRRNWFKIV